MGRRVRPAHRLEYAGFAFARWLANVLPAPLRLGLARALAFIAFRIVRIRAELVERQIAESFPSRNPAWVRRTAMRAYTHLGREAMAMLRMGRLSAEQVRAATDIEGWEAFQSAAARGAGIVVVTGHLGNWELGGAAVAARGLPIDVVAQRQSNPLFDRAINQVRERLGMRVIDRREASRRVLRSLREGRVVAFVADQDAKRSGAFVPFLGRPASTHRGPGLFAARSGAPMFVATSTRTSEGRYRVRFEEIDAQREGDVEDVVQRLTAAFTALLEREVRRAPDQYFWLHKRWKTRPRQERPGATLRGLARAPDGAAGRDDGTAAGGSRVT